MILEKSNKFSTNLKLSPEDFMPVSKQDQESLITMGENTSYWRDAWRRLKNNKIAMISLIVILLFIIFAFIGPYLSPYTYDQQIRGDENLRPCAEHLFGTDKLGRDLLVRTMVGARISLLIGIGSALIVLVIGSIYGSISGLVGGKVDMVMMRIVEIIYSLPDMLVIILLRIVLQA
ncbi:ABC transporter permease, partial [Terrisporobacter hibernicus]|uniref:ABC transporter permease n=1 Tax=Terrisporobacter hibernicus TaxID=2813371 RepID=UPI0023EFE4B0